MRGERGLLQIIACQKFHGRLVFTERGAGRISAAGNYLNLLAEEPPQHREAAIGGREVLLGMKRDLPLPDLCFPIARVALSLGLGHFAPSEISGAKSLWRKIVSARL